MHRLMLPAAHDHPAVGGQCRIHRSVPGHVSLQLWSPVAAIPLWLIAMLRAAMPEASIDKDCDPSAGKDNVRSD